MNRDYSLLRTPQTPEDFEQGIQLKLNGQVVHYIGQSKGAYAPVMHVIQEVCNNELYHIHVEGLGIKPVCWVETKPVYVGDHLYLNDGEVTVVKQLGVRSPNYIRVTTMQHVNIVEEHSKLTWSKPAPKPVTYTRWLNIYESTIDCGKVKLRETRAVADQFAGDDRIDCISITFTV